MNKIVNFSMLYFILLVVEILFSLMVMIFINFSNYKESFDGVVLWNFWRVLFYGLPFVLLYYLLFKYIGNIKLCKPLLLSFFNLLIYTLLSILSRVIWGKNVPLPPEGIMFWVTCMSIILSPLILSQIPYLRKIMETL